jgi:hypothetical protein
MQEKTAVLKEIDRTLRKRSVLMIDVPNPYRKDRGDTYVVEWQAGQEKIRLRGYAWYPDQFEKICGDLGFSQIRFLGDYSVCQAHRQGSRRMILWATRQY